MNTAKGQVQTTEIATSSQAKPRWVWRAALSSGEGRVGAGLSILVFGLILMGRFFAPYRPNAIGVGPAISNPSREHLLGTDELGRDVLSRLLVGGTSIILVPVIAVTVSLAIGAAIGMLGAYRGGIVDLLATRGFDLLLTLPPLLVVLVLISGLGTSSLVLILTLVVVYTPRMGRVTRGATQAVVTSDYVAAAQARGEHAGYILSREVLPNIISPTIADYALRITYGVIFIATLNFLGLGVQPPHADWGVMVAEGRDFINIAPAACLAPAVAIALLSVGLNLIADAFTQQATHATHIVPL